MATSFGQLLANAFPNNKVQAVTPPQVPNPYNAPSSKPTTSFGQLMSQPTGSTTVNNGSNASRMLTGTQSSSSNPIQSALQPAAANNNTSQTQQGTSIPPFSFDWTQADQEALDKLTPYYQSLLDQAKGDMNLAKSRLEEDYTNGQRIAQENLTSQQQADTLQKQQETKQTLTDLNGRGVLSGEKTPGDTSTSAAPTSDYANQYYLNPLQQTQQARALAIQRAFTRQQQQDTTDLSRKEADMATQQSRYEQSLNEQKKNEAINQMAPMQYQQELSKYNTALSGILNA